MKTLTAITVAAALAAGMSVAGAATPMHKPMQKSGYHVNGHSAFCTKTPTGMNLTCKYASRASCEKVAKPGNKTCMPNPKMASRSMMKKPSMKKMKK